MAGNVVPRNAVIVLVVQNSQASLVMVFLKAFDGDTDIKFSLDGTFFETFEVVWLRSSRFASATPMTIGRWSIGGRDTRVASAGPEPTIYIDGLQVFSIAAFAFEVALAARSVNGANVIWKMWKLCQKFSNSFCVFLQGKQSSFSTRELMMIAIG